ncbi:MAG: ATP-dependent DNA helicase RecG [bacterium]|nr:ATP-dependent DNA helicase RecG [bacterium]
MEKLLIELDIPVRYVKGVGPKKACILKKLGINTVCDLLQYYPRAYQDRTSTTPIFRLISGERQTVKGHVIGYKENYFPRKGVRLQKVIISDGLGKASLLFFNQPRISRLLPKGSELFVTGRIRRFRREIQIYDFDFEVVNKRMKIHTNRIVPIYPVTCDLQRVGQRMLRGIMKEALEQYIPVLRDPLPNSILLRYALCDLSFAIQNIHFPLDKPSFKKARDRLAFDELFLLQLGIGLTKKDRRKQKGIAYRIDGNLVPRFLSSLPFSLTRAQMRVIDEIKQDMKSSYPMNRLIHGDVGSGKTIVAICACLISVENGYQVAFMAPTEVLASQHFLALKDLLSKLPVKIGLLISDLKKKEREEILTQIERGEISIVIGTHALIQEGVTFRRLGVCIIDEQHKFGVMQRGALIEKAKGLSGGVPDILVMTATPIPRTLALTIYGDLDVSCLDELPPGRKKVLTFCRQEEDLPKIYEFLKSEIRSGRQAYIVYPAIEGHEELDLKAAEEMVRKLQKGIFKDYKLALLHGRMKTWERDEIMKSFRKKEIDILVSTTVIEVGIDLPNATVMLIEDAHRFGLAQLHQLRGRVGRGDYRSYCILVTKKGISDLVNSKLITEEDTNRKAIKRLQAIVSTADGFQIADRDLQIRGPGELFGVKQHGRLRLSVADIIKDVKLLEHARREAFSILEEDPHLDKNQGLKKTFDYYFVGRLELAAIS